MAKLKVIDQAVKFAALKYAVTKFVGEWDQGLDAAYGKREPHEFYPTDASFEPHRNKLVTSASVMASVNLIAAHFMARTWPAFIIAKLREYGVGKIASAAMKSAATKISVESGAKAISSAIGAVVGAVTTTAVQIAEMKDLEKKIRAATVKVRRDLNALALSQTKKSSRMGPVSTRNG